jgi:hypothetical protein
MYSCRFLIGLVQLTLQVNKHYYIIIIIIIIIIITYFTLCFLYLCCICIYVLFCNHINKQVLYWN